MGRDTQSPCASWLNACSKVEFKTANFAVLREFLRQFPAPLAGGFLVLGVVVVIAAAVIGFGLRAGLEVDNG